MSTDDDQTPQPCKRKKLIVQESEDSDESVVLPRRRKRAFRVISEGDTSDEDSDVPRPIQRSVHRHYRVISEDETSYDSSNSESNRSGQFDNTTDSSEWQSDWSTSDSERKSKKKKKAAVKAKTKKVAKLESTDSENSNSSENEQTEKCPICLLPFRKQEIGTPGSCEHCFCLDCLLEWSKNVNTCPVDRQSFTVIRVRRELGGKITRCLPVEVVPRQEEQVQEDPTFCEVCQQSDREDRMLLCDGCDSGYHLECLTPPMSEVPMEEWFCPECAQNSQDDAEAVEIDLDEILDLMEEARRLGVSYGRTRTGQPQEPRMIPRTRHTERVRATIRRRNRLGENSQEPRRQPFDPNQPSTSSGLDSFGDNSRSRSPSSADRNSKKSPKSTKDTTTRYSRKPTKFGRQSLAGTKKKKRKKKRVKKDKVSDKGTLVREVRIREINQDGEEEEIVSYVKVTPGGGTVRRRKGRKYRKRRRQARTVSSVLATSRKRLALSLGICKPVKASTVLLPTVRRRTVAAQNSILDNARFGAGITRVSLFGEGLGVSYSPPGSEPEDYAPSTGPTVSLLPRRTHSLNNRLRLKSIPSPTDLLSTIMAEQQLCHSKSPKSSGNRGDHSNVDNTSCVRNLINRDDSSSFDNRTNVPNVRNLKNTKNPSSTPNTPHPRNIPNLENRGSVEVEENLRSNRNLENTSDIAISENSLDIQDSGNRQNPLNIQDVESSTKIGISESLYAESKKAVKNTKEERKINSELIVQAPMYNNPCGGGNRGGFRGGYRDGTRNNHAGQNYGRDSLAGGGRQNYGGGGNHFGRDFGQHGFFNQGFECGGPMFGGNPPFRNRNPQQFRNERYRFAPPERQQYPFGNEFGDRSHPFAERFMRPRPPMNPLAYPPPRNNSLPHGDTSMAIHNPLNLSGMQHLENSGTGEILDSRGTNENLENIQLLDNSGRIPPNSENLDNLRSVQLLENPSDSENIQNPMSISSFENPSSVPNFENPPSVPNFENPSNVDSIQDPINIQIPPPVHNISALESPSGTQDIQNSLIVQNTPTIQNPPDFQNTPNPLEIDTMKNLQNPSDDENTEILENPSNIENIDNSENLSSAENMENPLSTVNETQSLEEPSGKQDEECDIYCDIEAKSEADYSQQEVGSVLLPPPEPPSALLDLERCSQSDLQSEADRDSEQELIIDDCMKEDRSSSRNDKYDPFSVDSESDNEGKKPGGSKGDSGNQSTDMYNLTHMDSSESSQDSQPPTECPNFSIYSPQTINLARRSQQSIIPLEPPPLPPLIPDDDDVIVGDVHPCDLAEIPEGSYVESLRKERRALSRIEERKKMMTSGEQRGKITFKIGGRAKIQGRLTKEEDHLVDREEERQKISKNNSEVIAEEPERNSPKFEEVPEKEEEEKISKIDAMEKSCDTIFSDTLQLSPKKCENEFEIESKSEEGNEGTSKEPVSLEKERSKDDSESEKDEKEDNLDDEEDDEEEDEEEEEQERFPIEKDRVQEKSEGDADFDRIPWESDGAYTPCKDEINPSVKPSPERTFEADLEPITPTKDKTDDFENCQTPLDYTALGTEAISETDEAMNFEDELTLLSLRREKEMEDGEIVEEKTVERSTKEKEEEKKKKKKKEKSKETEKNKENIASENQVSWKKLSKSTKERSYRDKEKRSKSKDKEKSKKKKEVVKKKEKRKELPRYDVRKIVAEKPSRPRKDEYGRDIREKSRNRSRSRSRSPSKICRSYSKLRSRSRSRQRSPRSWSRDRRSYSNSMSRRRSLSRGRRKSPKRRSNSRRISPPRKRSLSKRRSRSVSRKRRSNSRRRSRRRSVSRSRRSLTRSRDRRKEKKKYKSRSRSRNRKRSRSRSPRKASKSGDRKHSKRKNPSRSRSKGRSSCSRNWEQVEKIPEPEFPRERAERDSWSAQWTPSWSRSRSKSPQHPTQEPLGSHDWSPILENVPVPPKNLTVILTNKEAIKKKKKERRKDAKKGKEEKKRKGKRNRTPPTSKEVFASGDNILVSVCFNKDDQGGQTGVPELPETIPLIPPLKRRRRDPLPLTSDPPKRSKKDKSKDKRSKSPKPKKDKKKKSKAAEIAATKKPVAVIDLDQSPFREQTPSPRDVIVLSDDDDKQVQQATPEHPAPSSATPQHDQFVSQGPKTPPEPQIKFSINKQTSNLRPSMINPLLEEEEEEEEEEEMMDERVQEELELRAQEELELRLKIGPNTPPEPPSSPPTSPDAYDPFDPTKSRSPTPDPAQDPPPQHEHAETTLSHEETQQKVDQPSDKNPEKPKIISMVTIKRASPLRDDSGEKNDSSKAEEMKNTDGQQGHVSGGGGGIPFAGMNPVLATVAAAVQRSGVFGGASGGSGNRSLLQANRISPSSQSKPRLPPPPATFSNPLKPTARSQKSQNKTNGQNGNDAIGEQTENIDMSSPYSPGSTLSDGMFDPPSPGNFNNSPVPGGGSGGGAGSGGGGGGVSGTQGAKNSNAVKATKGTDKKDAFDALFGSVPLTKISSKPVRSKKSDKDKKKKPTNPKVGVRMDENQLQILDDLPSSAVEMQVKDKFLKKLNRQERVVEEVKLVLKPHYTKKHVTKEEYKDIMRKAVPKICHNKTGEINPKKIAHLIEAYVRKCRNSKKKTSESSSAKATKSAKILWS